MPFDWTLIFCLAVQLCFPPSRLHSYLTAATLALHLSLAIFRASTFATGLSGTKIARKKNSFPLYSVIGNCPFRCPVFCLPSCLLVCSYACYFPSKNSISKHSFSWILFHSSFSRRTLTFSVVQIINIALGVDHLDSDEVGEWNAAITTCSKKREKKKHRRRKGKTGCQESEAAAAAAGICADTGGISWWNAVSRFSTDWFWQEFHFTPGFTWCLPAAVTAGKSDWSSWSHGSPNKRPKFCYFHFADVFFWFSPDHIGLIK